MPSLQNATCLLKLGKATEQLATEDTQLRHLPERAAVGKAVDTPLIQQMPNEHWRGGTAVRGLAALPQHLDLVPSTHMELHSMFLQF